MNRHEISLFERNGTQRIVTANEGGWGNSAALLLWPEVCGQLVRFGIAAYGLWPSKETLLSVRMLGKLPVLHGHELPKGMAAPVSTKVATIG